jgi:serine/threonine-protein kinase HipA
MGRARKSRALSVWMNGELVGEWRRSAAGAQEFQYAAEWLTAGAARSVSLSLPLHPQSYRKGVPIITSVALGSNRNWPW